MAMLVSENPWLLDIEVGRSGCYSAEKNVHDFWRPLLSQDALVDGQFSVQCYLDALSGAYDSGGACSPGSRSGGG